MRSFNDNQISEIDNYRESIKWYYNSEQSLIELLKEVRQQLICVALPTIDFANNYIKEGFDTKLLYRKLSKKANELYLNQLDQISRFPID